MERTIPVLLAGTKVRRICLGTPKQAWRKWYSQWRENSRFAPPGTWPRDVQNAAYHFRVGTYMLAFWPH